MAESSVLESVVASAARLRAEHPVVRGHGWDFDGFRVWVESNEPALLDELLRYFADFRRLAEATFDQARAAGPITRITALQMDPPDFAAGREPTIGEYKPSVKGPKEAYFDVADGRVVHKLRTGMWFLFGGETHLAVGPCTDNPNQVINFINNRMIQWSLARGALLGHASAVCRPPSHGEAIPRAIAIAGFSGMGKSTLALRLMNDRRVDFLSNDRVMIQPRCVLEDGRARTLVEGVPKHPRINPGTILHNPDLVSVIPEAERARFEHLHTDELWSLEHKYDGIIHECFPNQRFWLHAELVGLVLLNWSREGGPVRPARIDVATRHDLLPALMKSPGVFYRPEDDGDNEQARHTDPHTYVEFLAGIEVLELAGGVDFERGSAAALELLGLGGT